MGGIKSTTDRPTWMTPSGAAFSCCALWPGEGVHGVERDRANKKIFSCHVMSMCVYSSNRAIGKESLDEESPITQRKASKSGGEGKHQRRSNRSLSCRVCACTVTTKKRPGNKQRTIEIVCFHFFPFATTVGSLVRFAGPSCRRRPHVYTKKGETGSIRQHARTYTRTKED
jgi:hypothetical protein